MRFIFVDKIPKDKHTVKIIVPIKMVLSAYSVARHIWVAKPAVASIPTNS